MHDFTPCTTQELKDILVKTRLKVSPSDALPAFLMLHCIDDILPYLVIMVNTSLSNGTIKRLDEALVRPLFKKNGLDPEQMKSYRPISNLSFISKLTEHVVLSRLTHRSIHYVLH